MSDTTDTTTLDRARRSMALRVAGHHHETAEYHALGNLATVTGSEAPKVRRMTPRGEATRQRILDAAAQMMYVKGVNAVTLDDVRAATATSKSQLYHHFSDKTELVRAVLAMRADQIMAREEQRLQLLKSMAGLRRWRNALLQAAALQNGAYGCALGSMAIELSDQDEEARVALKDTFATWERMLAAGLRRMQDGGTLDAGADPEKLAVGLMAALQGGYLLAQAAHDTAPMAAALDMALDHIESLTIKLGKPADK